MVWSVSDDLKIRHVMDVHEIPCKQSKQLRLNMESSLLWVTGPKSRKDHNSWVQKNTPRSKLFSIFLYYIHVLELEFDCPWIIHMKHFRKLQNHIIKPTILKLESRELYRMYIFRLSSSYCLWITRRDHFVFGYRKYNTLINFDN